MQFVKKVSNWGNSKGLVIPPEVLEFLDLEVGDLVHVEVIGCKHT